MRIRSPLAVTLLLAVLAPQAACTFHPAGTCASTAECRAGERCSAGLCVGCRTSAECSTWEVCADDHRCATAPGFCTADGQCGAWQACAWDHTCQAVSGRCDSSSVCLPSEACDATHRCAARASCTLPADCQYFETCDGGKRCRAAPLDPGAVHQLGSTTPGGCQQGAVAPLGAPTQSRIGLECASGAPLFVGPAGDLLYRSIGGVRSMTAEPRLWNPASATWESPVDAESNDPLVAPPFRCPTGAWRWLLRAGGDPVFDCPGPSPATRRYFDASGAALLAGFTVLSWRSDGLKLALDDAGDLTLLGGTNTPIPLTGLSTVIPLAARAGGTAFLLAATDVSAGDRLWSIAASGAATALGSYAPAPTGVSGARGEVLDATGRLFALAKLGAEDVVVERPLQPALATLVYRASAAPSSLDAGPAPAWIFVEQGALFTGP
jgi:hypothetical protein